MQGLGGLLKIEVKKERRHAQKKGKSADEGKKSKRKSMADVLDPNFKIYHQNFSSRRNSEANAKHKRPPVSVLEPIDPNVTLRQKNFSILRNTERNTKSKRPVSMIEPRDPKFNLYHQNHSSRRNTAASINLLENSVPPCGACHELTVDMLHLGPGLNVQNLSRCPSRQSLKRESWCENPLGEKADFRDNAQSQNSTFTALLHRQEHLVDYVKTLVQAVEEQDEHDSKREEWILVAEILDTFFLYIFVILMVGSTVLIFSAGTSW